MAALEELTDDQSKAMAIADLEELIDDLIYGARIGDNDEIHSALAAGAPVDGRDKNGTNALMMAAANGHVLAMQALLAAGADVNASNGTGNTAVHWAVLTGQESAVKALLAAGGCNLLLVNGAGCTAVMDAEKAGKGDLVLLMLDSLGGDERRVAAALGMEAEEEPAAQIERVPQPAGVDKTLDGAELKTMQAAPVTQEALPPTRGVLSAELAADGLPGALAACTLGGAAGQEEPAARARAEEEEEAVGVEEAPPVVTRERPIARPEIEQRVAASSARRLGDWRYSVLPAVVPREQALQLSRDFFSTTGLLEKEGNTFGPEFEAQYQGHRNYFYFINRNQVVPGAEHAAPIFDRLDAYTRQVVELHHPGVPVRLERAFGAYYEGGREGFHLGVNEHCDGDANLVSTVVHAVLPDGGVGFSAGGELTVSEVDGMPAVPIAHTNDSVGTVVYLGSSIFHHASPIPLGSRRLVFCMFYACDAATDLSRHVLA